MRLLFSFRGRIGRAQYWLGALGIGVIATVLVALILAIAGVPQPDPAGNPPQIPPATVIGLLVVYIPVFWSSLALGVKRCHDRGKSGWWLLVSFIPLLGALWLLVDLGFLRGAPDTNRWGPPAVPA